MNSNEANVRASLFHSWWGVDFCDVDPHQDLGSNIAVLLASLINDLLSRLPCGCLNEPLNKNLELMLPKWFGREADWRKLGVSWRKRWRRQWRKQHWRKVGVSWRKRWRKRWRKWNFSNAATKEFS